MLRSLAVLGGALILSGAALWWTNGGAERPWSGSAPSSTRSADPLDLPEMAPHDVMIAEPIAPAGAVRVRPLADPVTVAPCTLLPIREQEVSSAVDGMLLEVLVTPGQEVAAGQLLARLDPGPLRPQVELLRIRAHSDAAERMARAQFDEADSRVKYAEKANGSGFRSVPELEYQTYLFQRERHAQEVARAREERAAARKELEKAEVQLAQHEIRSAMNGTVVKVCKRDGEAVKQAEPLFRIANARRLRIEGLVRAQQAEQLHVGMAALVEPEVRGAALTELVGHTGAVQSLAVAPGGALLASAGDDRAVILWDWARGLRRALLTHPVEVYALAFAPDGSDRLVTGGADGVLRVWTPGATGEPQSLDTAHRGAVRVLAASADGRLLASGGDDKRVGIWDLRHDTHLYWLTAGTGLPAHQGGVTALHFTPDGRLVSAGRDNAVKVWNVTKDRGTLISTQAGRSGEVSQLGVHPNGRYVLFEQGEELRVLERATWTCAATLRSQRHGRFQHLATYDPTGRLLLTGQTNGRLLLWKAPIEPAPAAFFRHGYAHGFGRDSLARLLPLGSARRLAEAAAPRLWDLGGREVRQFATPSASRCAAFTPDGAYFFTGGGDRVVRVWAIPPAAQWDRPLEGVITHIGSQIERGTEMVRVRAEVDQPAHLPLRAGGHAALKVYPETAPPR